MNVFVYGTLKKGCINNYLLEKSEFLGAGETEESFAMYTSSCGNYPFVIDSQKTHPIKGELYCVSNQTIKQLDILEGYPDYYQKKKVIIVQENNKKTEAVMYIKNEKNYKDAMNIKSPIIEW